MFSFLRPYLSAVFKTAVASFSKVPAVSVAVQTQSSPRAERYLLYFEHSLHAMAFCVSGLPGPSGSGSPLRERRLRLSTELVKPSAKRTTRAADDCIARCDVQGNPRIVSTSS